MLIAPVVSPASSSCSYMVCAFSPRWRALRSTIVSRNERASPAARTAPNEDPYSTMRCSLRYHHTRCGISCTSGCAPVAMDERHTGVSDGNVDAARRYSPCSARKRSAGVSAASNIDGVRPSMTIRTTGLVARKRAEAGVPVGRAAAKSQTERRHRDCLEVPDHGDERERGDEERCKSEQCRRPPTRAAPPQCAADERRGAERAARATDGAADGFGDAADQEADPDRDHR